jgi:hypothetical protein
LSTPDHEKKLAFASGLRNDHERLRWVINSLS